MYYESFEDIAEAIHREKQIKGWLRSKKLALIQETNPKLDDLAVDWFPTDAIADAKQINDEIRSSNELY